MARSEKIEVVGEIRRRLEDSSAALLTEFRGLKVEEMRELRRSLRSSETDFKVVKNTLARLAAREARLDSLLPLLEGPTAIAFVRGDPVAAAKSLDEMMKKYPALVVKGGLLEGRVLDAEDAQALARTKPRDVLLAELAGAFQAPLRKVLFLVTAPLRSLGYAMAAYREKLEERGRGEGLPSPR
ncbi:MAG: 50S ribosomal protein L10 [Actinomycetota bacterium]